MLLPRLAGLAAALAVLPAAGCGDGDGAADGCLDGTILEPAPAHCETAAESGWAVAFDDPARR